MPSHLKFLATRLANAWRELRYVPRVWALVWRAARGWNVAWLLLIVVGGLLPVAVIQWTRRVVDSLLPVMGQGVSWTTLGPVLFSGGILAGVLIAAELMRSASNYVRNCQGELLQDYIAGLVQEKSASVDLAFYDWPDYYDHLHRAKAEAASRPVVLVESMGSLAQSCITLVAMAGVLAPLGLWLPLVLLASTAPALLAVIRYAVVQRQWREKMTAQERLAWYCDFVLTSRETAAELRLFGWGDHFRCLYQGLRRELREGRNRLVRQQALVEIAARVVAVAATAGAAAWMILRAIAGDTGPGDLVVFYQVFNQGQRVFEGLLQNAGQVYYNLLFLHDLFDFLDLPCSVLDDPAPVASPKLLADGVCFRNVRFKYPGSSRYALEGLDMQLPAGQITALVGANGSGKSTLIKLLCRLYDPQEGAVEWDGADVRHIRLADLRRMLTVLFQQPFHHQGTVRENLAIADLGCGERVRGAGCGEGGMPSRPGSPVLRGGG